MKQLYATLLSLVSLNYMVDWTFKEKRGKIVCLTSRWRETSSSQVEPEKPKAEIPEVR